MLLAYLAMHSKQIHLPDKRWRRFPGMTPPRSKHG
jgi:hypothetical protein